MKPVPLNSLRVSIHQIAAHQFIPNTSIQNKPLLIYHEAFPSKDVNASDIEKHLVSVGVVEPQWRYTMYSTTHFHSTTHEVLCIATGRAICLFGGEDNPAKVEAELKKGDVVILPAGVGHRLLQDLEGGFQMVGSYPKGKSWDMCYGKADETGKVREIEKLGWFTKDPVFGDQGPALQV